MSSTSCQRLLEILTAHQPNYVSGTQIGRELQISRNAVYKHIKRLQQEGYTIESCRHRGHRLLARPDTPTEREVSPLLSTDSFGGTIYYAPWITSTNTWASALAAQGAPEGTVAIADAQQNGKGRCGREWFSPAGRNLYFSLILRPSLEPYRITQLPVIVGMCIAKTLNNRFPAIRAGVKWPNDILCHRKKTGGILCEMSCESDNVTHVILGVGLNVNTKPSEFPADLANTSTSLQCLLGKQLHRPALLADILQNLELTYSQWQDTGEAPFLQEWPYLCVHHDEIISFETNNGRLKGRSTGITPEGALILETEDGAEHVIHSGDVDLLNQNRKPGTGAYIDHAMVRH